MAVFKASDTKLKGLTYLIFDILKYQLIIPDGMDLDSQLWTVLYNIGVYHKAIAFVEEDERLTTDKAKTIAYIILLICEKCIVEIINKIKEYNCNTNTIYHQEALLINTEYQEDLINSFKYLFSLNFIIESKLVTTMEEFTLKNMDKISPVNVKYNTDNGYGRQFSFNTSGEESFEKNINALGFHKGSFGTKLQQSKNNSSGSDTNDPIAQWKRHKKEMNGGLDQYIDKERNYGTTNQTEKVYDSKRQRHTTGDIKIHERVRPENMNLDFGIHKSSNNQENRQFKLKSPVKKGNMYAD